MRDQHRGALGGLRVLDFSRVLAGPYASMMLADMGADVLKVERPESGDDTRSWGPPYNADGGATYFDAANRNKRSVALDLGDASDRDTALRLAHGADVIIENFLPGTMAKFGLDYEAISGANPGVMYCSITGFGQQSDRPGYDLLVQATGGLMSVTGQPGDTVKVGVALVDVLAGTNAAMGILAALHHRDRTGEGQRIEIDLLSTLLSGMVNQTSGYLGAGVVPAARGNRHPSIVPYESFTAADGEMVIAVGNDAQFQRFWAALELPFDARFATNAERVALRDEIVAIINGRLGSEPVQHWQQVLDSAGIPAGPVNSIDGALAFADEIGAAPTIEIDGRRFVRNPVRFSDTPTVYDRRPPALGDSDATWLVDEGQ